MAPQVKGKKGGEQKVGEHGQNDVAPDPGAVDLIHTAGQSARRSHAFHSASKRCLAVESALLQLGGLVFDMGLKLFQYLPLILRVKMEPTGQRVKVVVDWTRHYSNALRSCTKTGGY